MTALQRAYNAAKKKKAAYCQGKVNKTAVKLSISNYKKAATAKAQKELQGAALKKRKAEIEKTARNLATSGCKMSSAIAGKKKTAKRKTTTRRKKK